MKPVSQSEELLVPKPPENLSFSDDSSDSNEDDGQQEWENVHCEKKFEAISSSTEPHLLT